MLSTYFFQKMIEMDEKMKEMHEIMKKCFEIAKGILSSCERMPFSVRYDAFRSMKDGLLQVKMVV
jgi:hypothetical protein